jgi:hypothetical protein
MVICARLRTLNPTKKPDFFQEVGFLGYSTGIELSFMLWPASDSNRHAFADDFESTASTNSASRPNL